MDRYFSIHPTSVVSQLNNGKGCVSLLNNVPFTAYSLDYYRGVNLLHCILSSMHQQERQNQ
jgi:hypothetical protein